MCVDSTMDRRETPGTPSTPADQIMGEPLEPPGAPRKARLLAPTARLHGGGDDYFAQQLAQRLDSAFQHVHGEACGGGGGGVDDLDDDMDDDMDEL